MHQEKTLLPNCQAGDPVLREKARRLSREEITTPAVQQLIANIKHTVASRDYGVGLAAPQVGHAVALSVIAIKPTPNRPDREPFEQVIINPSYTGIGQTTGMWRAAPVATKGGSLRRRSATNRSMLSGMMSGVSIILRCSMALLLMSFNTRLTTVKAYFSSTGWQIRQPT